VAIYPTKEQLDELLAHPSDQPVVMVNLLRFKPRATPPDEGLSGAEAYLRYAGRMRKIVEGHGGRFLWTGRVDSVVIEDGDTRYDVVALVEYPSRKTFVKIAMSPEVNEIGVHRAAGLESQWLLATTLSFEVAPA
jgi:uncharacterized protein (DUF1330 family)